ncbi:MAG TPA: competence protein CoiA family protein [Anaeromyxobacteraceae bacterium]|nr:competence protein CoiA family protein [Anaeromyxobacteraceae bacterium]
MRAGTSGVKLAWARDREGRRVAAAALDARRRRERAPFACPSCGEEVVARLGPVRARHFAHLPGSGCPLTAPETALHLEAKLRLLDLCREAFAGERRVRLDLRCPVCRRPDPRHLASLGDGAVAEGSAGAGAGGPVAGGEARVPAPTSAVRADVLVTRGGAPALCLEVRVAHALEAGKEDLLQRLGLPAVEVDARTDWERVEGGETVVACQRSVGFPPCPACAAAARADAGRAQGGEAAAVAELEAYRARGLMGPRPGPPRPDPPPLSPAERRRLARAFRCPACGGSSLLGGERLLRHACPGQAPRAVAWRGYDGALVELRWWR